MVFVDYVIDCMGSSTIRVGGEGPAQRYKVGSAFFVAHGVVVHDVEDNSILTRDNNIKLQYWRFPLRYRRRQQNVWSAKRTY